MARQPTLLKLQDRPQVINETWYVGVDMCKRAHVAGFLYSSLLSRHQRVEHCPALSFENSREGFVHSLSASRHSSHSRRFRCCSHVTGQYHRALRQYLQDLDIPVYMIHVEKRREGLLKTDKRDALGLANTLYNQLEKGVQVSDAPRPFDDWFLPPKLPLSYMEWCIITTRESERVPSAKQAGLDLR